jgi:uncharacterized membrane protein
MTWYRICVALHVLAVVLWFGHMFFWSIIVGPIMKRFEPPHTGVLLRQYSLKLGGLGWPALCVLVLTGAVMLAYRGATWSQLTSGTFFSTPPGALLRLKLILVAGMICYQYFIGHRPAPRLIYVNMLAALTIVGLSMLLVRAPTSLASLWSFLW